MKPIARSLTSMAGADAVSRLLGFVITTYLARTLGPSSFGIISIGLSVLGYVVVLAGPGLNVLGTRQTAAGSAGAVAKAADIVWVRLFLGVVLCLLAVLGSLVVFGPSVEWRAVSVFVLAALPMAASPEWFLQGIGEMSLLAASRVTMYVAYLGLVVLLVHAPGDVVGSAVAFTGASAVAAAFVFRVAARRGGLRLMPFRRPSAGVLLRESWPLGVSFVMTQTIVNIPVLVVGAVLSSRDAGIFGAAMKLVFLLLMLDRVFFVVFLPIASRAAAAGADRLGVVAGTGMKAVLALTLPVTVLGMAHAPLAVQLVYGDAFTAAAPVVFWLMPYFAFTVVSTVAMSVLYADHREREFLKVLIIGTALLIAACIPLTVWAGAAGCAMALSAGELVMTVLLIVRVASRTDLPLAHVVPAFLLAAAVTGLVVWLLRDAAVVVSIVAGMGTFALAALVLRAVRAADLRLVREKLL